MTTARYRTWVAGALLGLMSVYAQADSAMHAEPDKAVAAAASEGRSGWDAVGSKAQESPAIATSSGGRSTSGADRHQARKREMVRRMFMLMVAYR